MNNTRLTTETIDKDFESIEDYDRVSPLPESLYSLRLKEWSRQIPSAKLSKEWEKSMLALIPNNLKSHHPRCLEKILNEVREIYVEVMVDCAIASIVYTGVVDKKKNINKLYNVFLDRRSECRYDLVQQRQLFGSKYYLSHPIMQKIVETGRSKLAEVIVDLESIVRKKNDFFDISSLRETMMSSIARVAATIKNDYYPEIVRIIELTIGKAPPICNKINNIGKQKHVETSETIKLLKCATNLFTQQIIRIMMKTIDELRESLTNYILRCPRLNLALVWPDDDDRLSIDPPIDEIYSMWHSVIESIENIANDLTTFEEHFLISWTGIDDRMKVSLPDWYASESHRDIDEALARAVGPLSRHFSEVADEFVPVTSGETRRRVSELVSMGGGSAASIDIKYSSSVERLSRQNERANRIADSLDNFEIGRLNQSAARMRLKDEIAATRRILVEGMLLRHERYNEEICRDFSDLRDKLLDVPNSACELFKLSETIAYPSMNIVLGEFESRVARSIEMLSSLLAVTSDMSSRHTRLNGTTINWLSDIKPIVAKSNTLCEAMKSELEDELQRRIVELNQEIETVLPKFEILDLMDDATRVDEYSEHVQRLVGYLDELDRRIQEINYEERLFKFPETSFPSVDEIRDILVPVSSLNKLVREWRRDHSVWLNGPFEYVDAVQVRRKTLYYRDNLESLNASLKVKIKNEMQQSSGGGSSGTGKRFKLFSGIVDDPDPMQQPAPLTMCSHVLEEVKQFEGHLELIDCVCNPSLRERHWREISIIYEQSRRASLDSDDRTQSSAGPPKDESTVSGGPAISAPDAGTTLAKLIRLDLAKDIDKYRVISIGANKELALATRLDEMIAKWDTVDFGITSVNATPLIMTFRQFDEIETLMEEHGVVVSEMRVSYFVKPIATKLQKFSGSLSAVGTIVKTWLRVQNEWHDLETVFRRPTANQELARARELFLNVRHDAIGEVERRILEEPKFQGIARSSSKLSKLLSFADESLEKVRATVENYVQQVRNLFPRFYFISDREVIDIIFEPEYFRKMRLFVRTCFTDMRNVRCSTGARSAKDSDEKKYQVTSIIDRCDREFSLVHNDPHDCSIPDDDSFLVGSFIITENSIVRTVRACVVECSSNLLADEERAVSILTNCSMTIAGVCSLRLYWTNVVEEAINRVDAISGQMSLKSQVLKQTRMLKTMSDELRSERLSRKRRRTLVTFVIQTQEQQETTRLLIDKVSQDGGRLSREDFVWMSKIRYYWRDDDIGVTILNTDEKYGYEYIDADDREPIIRTPLTERCHHSLIEAHRNRYYGLVFGPSSTGKTSTIEALARTIGVDLRIFDCAQRHLDDYRYMDNIFRGLVARSTASATSCWILFENIDLIAIRGLSVVAQRITSITSMVESRCLITGTITSERGSTFDRSRDSLPDTLKALFRPISFAFPDAMRIVETLLFAEGFTTATILAEKLRIFEKCSNPSYSFGLRTMILVVKNACALKIRYPEEIEDAIFVRALVDAHLPKLTSPTDLRKFQYAIDDLFPNVTLPPPKYENLLSAVERAMGDIPLESNIALASLTLKIIQLFEMMLVRHAVIVVGSALAGKTTVIETLVRSMSFLDQDLLALPTSIRFVKIHHDSFSDEELFGDYNEFSEKLSWRDGILTRTLRSFVRRDQGKQWQWLVLDGPLEIPFIEKLTTLIDENEKTLYLRSGEKILLADSTSIIFETSSTIAATPTTLSRCGIIHLDESSTIGWKIRIRRWILERQRDPYKLVPSSLSSTEEHPTGNPTDNDKYAVFLQSLLEWSLSGCLEFLSQNAANQRTGLPISENQMVASVLRLFEMHLTDARGGFGEQAHPGEDDERAKSYTSNFFTWSQGAFLMSLVWGLGGPLDRNSRVALDGYCRSVWRTNRKLPHELIGLPSEGLIQDHTYVFAVGASGTGGSWRPWSDVLKREAGDVDNFWSTKSGPNSYVPTIDSVRYLSLFQSHVKYRKPFVVLGETATGKTLLVRHLLRTRMKQLQSNFYTLAADCSLPEGSLRKAQNWFLSRMKKFSKGHYGPSEQAEICVNFIDDMSITRTLKDEAILRELTRQYHEDYQSSGCWYNLDSGDKIRLKDVVFLGAIDSGADKHRHDRTSVQWYEAARFFRHFSVYSIDRPSDESIYRINYNILFTNLRLNMFNADVAGSVTSMVNATIDVYKSIVETLRPVPKKFQYRFSLRDASRVIDGCSLIHKESAETKVTLMKLWVHETIRVFADRIVDPQDAEWLFTKIREAAVSHFKDSWETAFDSLPKYDNGDASEQLTKESFRYLAFSDFMRIPDEGETVARGNNGNSGNENNSPATQRRYEEITCSREVLKNRANFYLERYNETSGKLDVIIFPEMLEHLVRICRILEIPGGSLLMMSFGASSGRRSLVALAAHIKSQRFEELSCSIVESMMTPNSPVASAWRQDFKRACMNCISEMREGDSERPGRRIRDCTFFISDREIIGSPNCRSLMVDICGLMKTGQATEPSLFTDEERDSIVERCRLLAQKGDRNREMSSHEIMDYFRSKCQEKLHFVLYFDLPGMKRKGHEQLGEGTFAKILRHCSVNCFESWPREALSEIGNKFLRDIDLESRLKSGAIMASEYFWKSVTIEGGDENGSSVRKSRGLPISAYIHMVKLYGLSINKRQNETRASRERYLSGLDKLRSADEEVRKMQSTLTRLRPELELSAEETAETMRKIEQENVSVEMATIQVKREEEVANGIAEVAGILKAECEADLAVAIPILEDAIAALNTLKPTDITLVKAMKNPPDTVKLVLAAVCVMLGVPPDRSVDPVTGKKSIDFWAPSKRILGDMNFLQNLKDYDKDNIPSTVMSVINKNYMNDESFMPHIVAKASSAAEGLCKWVRAMVSYDEVAKVVAPKKEKLAAAERECNAGLEYLNEKRTMLAALNDKLAALNASLEATLAKKLQLENEVTNCTNKLKRAEALIASLAGEKTRWLETAETLAKTCENLAGDVLLSCGLVALLSSFGPSDRHAHIVDWRNELDRLSIPNSGDSYDFLGSLRSSESRHHRAATNDSFRQNISMNSPFNRENALILDHTLLWPLILDPQNQANAWLKRVESSNGLVIVKPTNPKWFTAILDCAEKKLPVLLENLDRPEYLERTPSILRYLAAASSTFKFYITSRISFNEAVSSRRLIEPHDMYKLFNVVNFTLANDALEDRLLEIIVSRERPELRDTFDRLMITSATNRRLLDREEDKILWVLSGTSVNIIEDERAIESLDRWKMISHEIRMREAETARATEREMNELQTTYRPLTKYCAALYDTLASLVNFNHMYRFSLDWFVRLYVRSIDTSMKSVVLTKRLSYLGSSFTHTLDASVRNALQDEHKLLYSFLLSIKILLDAKKLDRTELRTLLLASSPSNDETLDSPFTATDRILLAQQLADALPSCFEDLPKSIAEDSPNWEAYLTGSEPLPALWIEKLTDFQRLILVNRLRPEKTLGEVVLLVENTLGPSSITASSATKMADNVIARSYDESNCVVPLIFVLPCYLEPFRLIEKWARTIGYSSRIVRFSMPPSLTSREYYSEIEGSIDRARQHGGWVMLENCHLASDEWLARLEEISESLANNDNGQETALSFRLWLTSYPSGNFPISILHDGTKIYCERPGDRIKKNLLNFYATEPLDDPDFYDTRSGGNNARRFAKLVCALCFFHAIVTGRNRFYERAWNVPSYEFTDSDLKISIGHLRRFFILDRESGVKDLRKEENEENFENRMLETLVYLVGECYYGGKIVDPADRSCLGVILENCCNSKLTRSTTNYILDDDGPHEYSVPNRSEYRDFIRHINTCLPSGESSPGIFGLDANAAVIRDYRNSNCFVRSFARSLSFIDDDLSEPLDDAYSRPRVQEVIQDIRKKLLLEDPFDLTKIRNEYPHVYQEPLNSLVLEQARFYNEIIDVIRASLADVEKTMYEHRHDLIDLLTRNRVPLEWITRYDPTRGSSSLSRFLDNLANRREFLKNWTKNGHYGRSIWMGGIFDCKQFFISVRLTFSRKFGISLHRLAIDYEVTNISTNAESWNEHANDSSKDSIQIHGLYLSAGARWDIELSMLVESSPELYWHSMPVICCRPRSPNPSSIVIYKETKSYLCPLNFSPHFNKIFNFYFLGSLSNNYVTTVPLKCKNSPQYWIKRGIVLFCNK